MDAGELLRASVARLGAGSALLAVTLLAGAGSVGAQADLGKSIRIVTSGVDIVRIP